MEPTRTVRYRFDDKSWQYSLRDMPVSLGEYDEQANAEVVYEAACGLVKSQLSARSDISSGDVLLEDGSGAVLREQHFG